MDKDTLKRVGSNAKAVMDEADQMLQSLKLVKGGDYCSLVRMMLFADSLSHTLRVASSVLDKDSADKLHDGFQAQLLGLLGLAFDLASVPRSVISEAAVDAEKIETKVKALMDRAVASAVDGKGFG